MRDDIRYDTSYGDNSYGAGNGDGADYTKANIKIKSWYGIGFHCTLDDTQRVYVNTRNGDIGTQGTIYAHGSSKVHDDSNLSFSLSGTTLTITKS